MKIMPTPRINKMIIFYSFIQTYGTDAAIFLHFNHILEDVVLVLGGLWTWVWVGIWFDYHHLSELTLSLLDDVLLGFETSQCQQVVPASDVRINECNAPPNNKYLMWDQQQPDPRPQPNLNTQHTVYRMQLSLLPKSNAHEQIGEIDQTDNNNQPPIGNMMLVNIDGGEFVDKVMLDSLEDVEQFVDLECVGEAGIGEEYDGGYEKEDDQGCIQNKEQLVDQFEFSIFVLRLPHYTNNDITYYSLSSSHTNIITNHHHNHYHYKQPPKCTKIPPIISHPISIHPIYNPIVINNPLYNINYTQFNNIIVYYIHIIKYINKYMKPLLVLLLIVSVHSKCSFQVGLDNVPVKITRQPFKVEGMTQCVEYNGKMGCCDAGNDQQQSKSFTELDGVFSSLGGGCDICAINLKRFWCEYACSPNQAEFTDVEDGYFPIPDPQKPGEFITAQKITIRVQAQTACDLFNACNRNEFVSAVSAMSTPAGFLTFQGHNAVNDALQYMEIKFSYNKSNSIYFGNDNPDETGKALHNCNTTTSEKKIHGFPFQKNCTCNNCGTSCKSDEGFIYTESSVLEDFNYILVGGTWAVSILIAALVTIVRNKKQPNVISNKGFKKLK